ncbi:MerR family transcriptional regulator [Afifella marina]|uniref:DNA-binding transcriptional regulator, MerR family n=1 Tax=Afifella marina DSM 2698 TaxID=1120955 RepID=A0A1G5M5J3_AFIMA|nr:MerR family DNA-binding transcriptional regulator [Afifella marina]MBK1623022.1 transcriptional regulator [Afifella marina DSM 2698]MBK1626016.1 transcriptional regulator [Afifella marina]MBK5917840.1 transcriptional regulator [Afifella marina]RAI18222.1 transcriptional regulator [Afifella marina DSM 2698]SCZ19818.1 DNA-binding transcriptional regulator, MerR family [Afifella marina DSM 2698]
MTYSIGELSREFGVTLRTLRFYEDKGLLNPRREGLNRIYSRRDRARLKLVLMGKKVGFSLVEIKEILDLYDMKDGEVLQMQVALDKFEGQVAVLKRQREEIEHAIDELSQTMDAVRQILTQKQDEQKQAGEAA